MAIVLTIDGNIRTNNLIDDSISISHEAGAITSTCSFILNDPDNNIDIVPKTVVTIVDGATVFFAGVVANVDMEVVQESHRKINVSCQDYNILVEEAVIDQLEEYGATNDDVIIADLFATYRADIIIGAEVANLYLFAEIAFADITLRQAMDDICTQSDGRWYVDDSKELHYFLAEGDAAPFDLSDTPDFVNTFPYLMSPTKREDSANMMTRVYVKGPIISLWRTDAAAEAIYGQHPGIVADNRAFSVADLTARGDAYLTTSSTPEVSYNITVRYGGLRAGMDIGFKNDILGENATFVIRRINTRWENNWQSIYFDLEIGANVDNAVRAAKAERDQIQGLTGPIPTPNLPYAVGFSHDLVFSSTDNDTVAWTGGTITAADGFATFAINAGNTDDPGAMVDITFVYFDPTVSLVDLQMTTTMATALIGTNKCLVATCAPGPAAVDASFQVHAGCEGDSIGSFYNTDNLAADSITAGLVGANTIITQIANIDTAVIVNAHITDVYAHRLTADKLRIGESFYNTADGIMLYNGFCEIGTTEWWSTARQKATLTGAIHQARGRWQGTRALFVEPGNKNYIKNPSFEVNVTDDWTLTNGARQHKTSYYYVGSASCRLTADAVFNSYQQSGAIAVANGETVTAQCRVLRLGPTPTASLAIRDTTNNANRVVLAMTKVGVWEYLEVTWENDTGGAVNVAVRLFNTTADGASNVFFDAVQMEHDQDYATHYFDGTFGSGYAWDVPASPHNSYSTRTKTTVDLDAYAKLLSSRNTFSIRAVVQMPFDADGDWASATAPLFDTRKAADNNNRIAIHYLEATDDFRVYINGAYRLDFVAQTFKRGDWVDIVVTFDFTADDYNLYINGVLADNDGTVLAPPAGLTLFNIGSSIAATLQSGFAFAEFAVFDRVVTAVEVAQIYNLQRPLVDAGTDLAPGIYILDGKFKIASSTSGNRIEIVADHIAGYNSGGTLQFEIDSETGEGLFGAGAGRLTSDGFKLYGSGATGNTRTLRFIYNDAGTERVMGNTYSDWAGGANKLVTWVTAQRPVGAPWPAATAVILAAVDTIAGDDTRFELWSPGYGKMGGDLRVTKGLYVGADVAPQDDDIKCTGSCEVGTGLYVGNVNGVSTDNDIKCDGTIETARGSTWDVGAYNVGVFGIVGYVWVTVDGVNRRICVVN